MIPVIATTKVRVKRNTLHTFCPLNTETLSTQVLECTTEEHVKW